MLVTGTLSLSRPSPIGVCMCTGYLPSPLWLDRSVALSSWLCSLTSTLCSTPNCCCILSSFRLILKAEDSRHPDANAQGSVLIRALPTDLIVCQTLAPTQAAQGARVTLDMSQSVKGSIAEVTSRFAWSCLTQDGDACTERLDNGTLRILALGTTESINIDTSGLAPGVYLFKALITAFQGQSNSDREVCQTRLEVVGIPSLPLVEIETPPEGLVPVGQTVVIRALITSSLPFSSQWSCSVELGAVCPSSIPSVLLATLNSSTVDEVRLRCPLNLNGIHYTFHHSAFRAREMLPCSHCICFS